MVCKGGQSAAIKNEQNKIHQSKNRNHSRYQILDTKAQQYLHTHTLGLHLPIPSTIRINEQANCLPIRSHVCVKCVQPVISQKVEI